jgi:hypothetical protein
MIGRRGYRIAERPRASFRPVPLNFASRDHRARVCHARDPPTGCGAEIQDLRPAEGGPVPEKALGQRRHPPAQSEPSSTRNHLRKGVAV